MNSIKQDRPTITDIQSLLSVILQLQSTYGFSVDDVLNGRYLGHYNKSGKSLSQI